MITTSTRCNSFSVSDIAVFLDTEVGVLNRAYKKITGRALTKTTLSHSELTLCLQGMEQLKHIGRWQSVYELIQNGISSDPFFDDILKTTKPETQTKEKHSAITLEAFSRHCNCSSDSLKHLFRLYYFREIIIGASGFVSHVDILALCKLLDSTGTLMSLGRKASASTLLNTAKNAGFPSKVPAKNYFKGINSCSMRQADAENLWLNKTGQKLNKSFLTLEQLKLFYPLYLPGVQRAREQFNAKSKSVRSNNPKAARTPRFRV